jgi:hypothetical protein
MLKDDDGLRSPNNLHYDDYDTDADDDADDYVTSRKRKVGHTTNQSNDKSPCNRSKLHISLSRPFYIQEHSIQAFVSDLQQYMNKSIVHPLVVRVPVYVHAEDSTMLLVDAEILTNDEKTRSFLTLRVVSSDGDGDGSGSSVNFDVHESSPGIQSIIQIVDKIMEKYGYNIYHKDPKFHISIASWNYNEQLIEKWNTWKRQSEKNVGGIMKNRTMLTFILRGIHCDFGKIQNYWIPFGTDY